MYVWASVCVQDPPKICLALPIKAHTIGFPTLTATFPWIGKQYVHHQIRRCYF